MKAPVDMEDLLAIHRELVARNGIEDGLIYLQVTRGAADRDFAYPPEDTPRRWFCSPSPSRVSPTARRRRRGSR
jgi:branched-subunit amino acid aminotransferase/4-amino-4-deoxychorismate lyase